MPATTTPPRTDPKKQPVVFDLYGLFALTWNDDSDAHQQGLLPDEWEQIQRRAAKSFRAWIKKRTPDVEAEFRRITGGNNDMPSLMGFERKTLREAREMFAKILTEERERLAGE
jgi:hypothetical protein